MLSQNQLAWLKGIGEVIGGILLFLAKSPLKRADNIQASETPSAVKPQPQSTGKEVPTVMFNFATILKLFTLAPVVVAGIEQLHGEKDSTTKQTLAQQSLMLATGVADAVDPNDKTTTDAVSSGVASIIDSTVDIFNKTGLFSHKTPAPAAS